MKSNTTAHVGSVSHRDRKAKEPSGGRTQSGLGWGVSHWKLDRERKGILAVGLASSKA